MYEVEILNKAFISTAISLNLGWTVLLQDDFYIYMVYDLFANEVCDRNTNAVKCGKKRKMWQYL